MAARGLLFGEGPTACPFVALETDRDRRSDEPDHRHRCYAEPQPAPRALAHQRTYCLAAAFTTCPIFQDWAIRSAATPVPLRPRAVAEPRDAPPWSLPPSWLTDEPAVMAASSVEPAAHPESAPPFEAARLGRPSPAPEEQVERVASLTPPDRATGERASPVDGGAPPPPFLASRVNPTTAPAEPDGTHRSRREPAAAPAKPTPQGRAAVVPDWEWQPLYPAARRLGLGGAATALRRLARVGIVGALVVLAVVGLALAPRFLDRGTVSVPGGAFAGRSPSPTTFEPSPTVAVSASPASSPRTYAIRSGDTLFAVALAHGVTMERLLAANPEITNPNLIQVGQVVIIPEPDSQVAPTPPSSPP